MVVVPMRTFPLRDDAGRIFAFEIPAQLFGWRLAKRLLAIPGISDGRPRRWGVGPPDVHIRFRYRGQECVVWEPYGDNSRWWIGPDDETAPHVPLDELERAIAAS